MTYRIAQLCVRPLALDEADELLKKLAEVLDIQEPVDLKSGQLDWLDDKNPRDPLYELWIEEGLTLLAGWSDTAPTLSVELHATLDNEAEARELFAKAERIVSPDWGFIEPPGWRAMRPVRVTSPGASWLTYVAEHLPLGELKAPASRSGRWLRAAPKDTPLDDSAMRAGLAAIRSALETGAAQPSPQRVSAQPQPVSAERVMPRAPSPPKPPAAPPRRVLESNHRLGSTAPLRRAPQGNALPFNKPAAGKPGVPKPRAATLEPHPALGGTLAAAPKPRAASLEPHPAFGETQAAAPKPRAATLEPHPALGGTQAVAPKPGATSLEPHPALGGTQAIAPKSGATSREPFGARGGARAVAPQSGVATLEPHPALGGTQAVAPKSGAGEVAAGGALPFSGEPRALTIEQYAALTAELASGSDGAAIRQRYGLRSQQEAEQLDRHFLTRFRREPELHQRFMTLVSQHRAKLPSK